MSQSVGNEKNCAKSSYGSSSRVAQPQAASLPVREKMAFQLRRVSVYDCKVAALGAFGDIHATGKVQQTPFPSIEAILESLLQLDSMQNVAHHF
jgi:hypothetical protein